MRASSIHTLRHTGLLRPSSNEHRGYPMSNTQSRTRTSVSSSEDAFRHGSSRDLLTDLHPSTVFDEGGNTGPQVYTVGENLGNEDAHIHIPEPNYSRVYTPSYQTAEPNLPSFNAPSPGRLSNEDQSSQLIERPSAAGDSDTTLNIPDYQPSRWLSCVAVTIPPMIVPAIIVTLIYVYWVPSQTNLLTSNRLSSIYVLVDLEDTRIMLIVSALGVISQLIGKYIMGLYAPQVVQRFKEEAAKGVSPSLYEFALIGGQCQASVWQYLKTPYYWLRRSATSSKTLRLAHVEYSRLIFLWLMTYGAIGLLHLTTRMVEYDKLDFAVQYSPGRGLTEQCLEYNRINRTRKGFPCTYDRYSSDRADQLREAFYLQRNASIKSRINFVPHGTGDRTLGLLLARDVPAEVDYRTSTLGLCTDCSFVTEQCAMHDASQDMYSEASLWTIFNCSSGFYGVLGKAPIVIDLLTATDGDIPYLGYKYSLRLQVGYFFDPGLEYPYNPVGYDTELNRTVAPYSDAELTNPVYLGVAGRIDYVGLGEDFIANQELWSGQNRYLEFALRCKITAFDVSYSYVKGALSDISLADTNGTIFELFHGIQFYNSFTSHASDFLEMLSQASLQNSTSLLARKWETLFSTKALSAIGSVTDNRTAITQQERERVLVARMEWPALAFLFFCPLCYVVAGVSVILSTRKVIPADQLLGEVLRTPGAGFTATSAPAYMQEALGVRKGGDLPGVQGQVTIVESGDFFRLRILERQGQTRAIR